MSGGVDLDPGAESPPDVAGHKTPAKPKSSHTLIIIESICAAVGSVVAGKLTDLWFPGFRGAGVAGAVVGGVAGGLIGLGFHRLQKRRAASRATPPV